MIKQEQLMDLRQYRENGNITQEQLIDILNQGRSTVQTRKKVTLSERKLSKFFTAYYSQTEMERIIYGLLAQWKEQQEGDES